MYLTCLLTDVGNLLRLVLVLSVYVMFSLLYPRYPKLLTCHCFSCYFVDPVFCETVRYICQGSPLVVRIEECTDMQIQKASDYGV
jgi:hypothetical protein